MNPVPRVNRHDFEERTGYPSDTSSGESRPRNGDGLTEDGILFQRSPAQCR